jgi:protein-disulfide isomerase/uncharacterized membrane protein
MSVAALEGRAVRALPAWLYVGSVIGLCAAGLAISLYLALSHYRVHTDIGYQSFCALTRTIDCEAVSQSRWAVWAGLPVAVWGAAGYVLFLLLVLFARPREQQPRRSWTIALVLGLGFSAISLMLAAVSVLFVGSYCILCIATYGINFLLAYLAWLIRRRFRCEPVREALHRDLRHLWERRRVVRSALLAFGAALAAIHLAYPAYWLVDPPAASGTVESGITEDGHPWIGTASPKIVITEFTDYQCFQCRKVHYYLRRLMTERPGVIQLVHRHFPLDHEFNPLVTDPFHLGSGRMALLAIHAALAGRFWEMNDRLYEKAAQGAAIDLPRLAVETGLDARELAAALEHPPYRRILKQDIIQAGRLGVAATPSYLIGGQVYAGGIPADILKPLFEKEARQ